MLARANFGIAALQAIQPNDFQRLILVIGGHGDGSGGALAFDGHDIAFGNAQRLERGARHADDALSAFLLPGGGDLQPDGGRIVFRRRICGFGIGHASLCSKRVSG